VGINGKIVRQKWRDQSGATAVILTREEEGWTRAVILGSPENMKSTVIVITQKGAERKREKRERERERSWWTCNSEMPIL
jgi:hypothetical protein